jgi:hypothetical protein
LPKILVPALVAGPKRTTYVRFTGTGNWITQTGGNADESARLYDVSRDRYAMALPDAEPCSGYQARGHSVHPR